VYKADGSVLSELRTLRDFRKINRPDMITVPRKYVVEDESGTHTGRLIILESLKAATNVASLRADGM
jgi:hypothetical protein